MSDNAPRCPACDGRGQIRRAGRPVACPACDGTGERRPPAPIDHETTMRIIRKVAGL